MPDTDCIAVGPLSDLGTSLRANMGPTKVLWFDRHLFVLYTLELVGWGVGREVQTGKADDVRAEGRRLSQPRGKDWMFNESGGG